MTTEADGPQPVAYNGLIAILIIGLFTGIGFFIAMEWTNDLGTVKEGFWIGIGVAIVFLLSVVANNLARLRADY